MKIRNGFVSNSSSSSFVIVGREIKNPVQALKENKRVFVYIPGAGTSGDVEDWGMYIDNESYQLLKNSKWFDSWLPEVIYFECSNDYQEDKDENEKINILNDITNQQIFAFERDYSSPNSIKQLKKFLKGHC